MRQRTLDLQLDPHSRTPITLQIVEGLKAAIREGKLGPGDALPSTRWMADYLKVSRNTVLDAYDELAAEGYVVGRRGSGSFVAEQLPSGVSAPSQGVGRRDRVAFALSAPPSIEDLPATVLSCLTGQADPRLLPAVALARAYRKALEQRASANPRQRDKASEAHLREHLACLLKDDSGLRGGADNLLLTSGFQSALQLVAEALITPGDVVAVEELGARKHWDVLRAAGASLEPVPLDDEGLSIEALEALGRRMQVRAVLVSPRCQYPTTVPLSAERRQALLAWAEAHGVALLECDAESGIHYGLSAPPALAAHDQCGSVVYLGSFAKALFPGLPLAYIHAPTPLVAHLAACQLHRGQEADPVFEGAMTDLFIEGELHRHLARLRTALVLRRDALHTALQRHLGRFVSYDVPELGMAFWIKVVPELDVSCWAERAVRQGVAFTVGRRYRYDGLPIQALRLGFASHQEDELVEIVRRMAAAV